MEMKQITQHKTLWKMGSTSEPLPAIGIESSPLKKFTIPKIRRTTDKAYLSYCGTNTREYGFIHDTLNQWRLDVNSDLQSSWQFGDTKLVHNEDLENEFTAKRSEMRDNGRHGRELEEHFCFLALPHDDMTKIYQNGLSTKSSTLKILGNPLLGIYVFRYIDVALNYACSKNITVENIFIFKVLLGRVKKIQPSVDKDKVSLDPSPNFDCHMSRNTPSLKDSIELQAYNSVVYIYEYSVLSKPVDKPRQCLPYAVITVKFIGQKMENGSEKSLRFLSPGAPKRAERRCSLNNCTVAKRIGKGKDATVIFEHFRKPVDPLLQENCSCHSLNTELQLPYSHSSNSCGNRNIPMLEQHSGQTEHSIAKSSAHDSGLLFMTGDTRESTDDELLLNLAHLKNILSGFSPTLPFHNNIGSSTVITSKLIKDPRLLRREESIRKKSNMTDLKKSLSSEKSLDSGHSEINLSSVSTNSTSSTEIIPDNHTLHNSLDAPYFRIPFAASQSQANNVHCKDCEYVTPSKIATAEQCKGQGRFLVPISLSNVVSEVENQKYTEEQFQKSQPIISNSLLIKQNSDSHNSYETMDNYTENKKYSSRELQSSSIKTYQTDYQAAISLFQNKENIDKYIQNIGKVKSHNTDPENSSKHREKQNLWRRIDHFTNEPKGNTINNYFSLHQDHNEAKSLDSSRKSSDQLLITKELEIAVSSLSTTESNYKLDDRAVELPKNLTPSKETFLQNCPQRTLEYENNNIHTSLAISQKQMGLKSEKANKNCISMTDVIQDTKDISQAKDLQSNTVVSSQGIETTQNNFNYNITKEHTWVSRKNESELMSTEDSQKDGKDHSLVCDTQLNSSALLKIDFKEQKVGDEEQNEMQTEDMASSVEDNIENTTRDEQQFFNTNRILANVGEERVTKNCSNVEILIAEEFSTFNVTWEENHLPRQTMLIDDDSVAALQQYDINPSNGRHIERLASKLFPEASSTVSNDEIRRTTTTSAITTTSALSTNHEEHQRYLFKETCSSESSGFGLFIKSRISDCEIDKSELQDSINQSIINENFVIQSVELENEIEVETDQYDNAFLFQQDIQNHEHALSEALGLSYEVLKSRIDWEALLGSSNCETETNFTRRENTSQHYSKKSEYFCSSIQNPKAQLLNQILLPDLQIRITNMFRPGFSPGVDSDTLKDNVYKCLTKATKPEINGDEKIPGLGIHFYSSNENSDCPCEDKFDKITQESELMGKSETSHSFELNQNTHMSHISETQGKESLCGKSSNVTAIKNESSCSFAESDTDCNDRSKKNMESRISKRKLQTCFKDQNASHTDLRHQEMCEKKRRLACQDTYECFFSLSQGRMKTFSQSEKYIRSVLDILNSEASLCKSRRLSRKLDRAVLHLKKAHRRVHTSLQLITKVGEKRKGQLPKAYAIICNNFWESCDLEGYSSVYERKCYSTKHFFSKRKDDKEGERRALECDRKSLTNLSKHESYRKNGKSITEDLSQNNVASSVSRSHSTIHVEEFSNQEQLPELCCDSTFQGTGQVAYKNSNIALSGPSDCQPCSRETECLFSADHPDKIMQEEIQIDVNVLANISKCEKLENLSTHSNVEDVSKEINPMANEINESTVCLSFVKGCVSVYMDKNCDPAPIAHTGLKTDILTSALDSSTKQFLNVDTCKPDNNLSDCKRNLEVNFPLEEVTASGKNSKENIFIRNFIVDPLNMSLETSKKSNNNPQLFPTAPVIASERESSKSFDKQRVFAIDSSAISRTVPRCQLEHDGKEQIKTEQRSSSDCSQTDGNSTNMFQNSNLPLTSITEENKSCGGNAIKKLYSNDGSSLITQNVEVLSPKQCTTKDIKDRKAWKVKETEKVKGSVGDTYYKQNITKESSLKAEYKDQAALDKYSHLKGKTVKNHSAESYLGNRNSTFSKSLCVSNAVHNTASKSVEHEIIKINSHSQADAIVHSERTCNFKPDLIGINHIPISHAHPENSKVTTLQKPVSDMTESEKAQCSANDTGFIAKLSQMLQRADKASCLQSLQEETKICQNILPSFVEAFEKNQECSLEQILISRELLVQQNLWRNCKSKLKPCAVDSLVELQMVMETIQFIENKKRLLEDKQTYRSLLWYDETLYSELLGGPRGYQQQSNFYPGFQGRLKYNAFCELQKYHDQLIELLEETKRGDSSYYAFLKYKRQIKECEAIMNHCSDCFDFSLSIPFTCGVNFGDNLADLETLRKSALELINVHRNCPKVNSYPEKQDHLWIIIEMISSKISFIKSNEALSIKISLYGLEHIFFDAAKSLVWEEKKQSLNKKSSRKKYKEMLLNINQEAFSKMQAIFDSVSKDLSHKQASSIELEDTMIACKESDKLINKAAISIENYRFNSTLHSHPDICFISDILDQAEFADLKKLQELTLRCTIHLEILKKYFEMLQKSNIDDIFITEENVLDILKKHKHEAVVLKPEAVETYIEIVMILETVHFLQNSMSKKQDKQQFRGLLWFDLSLLPDLVHCQEKMACFSFLEDNCSDCVLKVVETVITEVNEDLDIISKYNEAVNSSYALHLLSRELDELSEIKKLLKKSKCSISTYIDFVPYIASINYGSTVEELEYSYHQFSTLLKNTVAAPRKDLGKMAHIMKVMKTIEHMKIICAKNAKLTSSFILCQMVHNRKKALQLKSEGRMNIPIIKRRESTCMKVPLIPKCVLNSPNKRPIIVDEDSQEQDKDPSLSTCKKQKMNMKDNTKINKERTVETPRTARSHRQSEKIGPTSSDNLRRNYVSPKRVEMPRSPPGSFFPLKDLKDTCTSNTESKIDLTNISRDISDDFIGKQTQLSGMKETNVNFSAARGKNDKKNGAFFANCVPKIMDNTFSKDHEVPSQECLKISPAPALNIQPGTENSFLTDTVCSKPAFHLVNDTHNNVEINHPVREFQDDKILSPPIKNFICTNFQEPVLIQNITPTQVNKTQTEKTKPEENYMKVALDPRTVPVGTSGNMIFNMNQAAGYSLSEQNSENSKVPTRSAATCWNELPQSAYTSLSNSSGYSFGASYPYYSWCVYHYSSISGNSITQTYHGITSYESQPLPSGMLTTVASTVQNTHSNSLCSQYFAYFAGEPQAGHFVPVNGYFQSQMPISYNFQQPVFSQLASSQPLPQAAYSYPPNPRVLPDIRWTYAPWQQESFQPGH